MPGRGFAVAACFAALCALGAWGLASRASPPAGAAESGEARSLPKFDDFGQLPPPDSFTPERVFRLSQDYPTQKPKLDPAVEKILGIDFTKGPDGWKAYMAAVLAYVLEGNIGHSDINQDFFLEDNRVRRWYHVPWQQWGDNGREGLHGLTSEGPIYPKVLSSHQTDMWQTYAVGFYNDLGGYEIGRVWADPDNPRIDAVEKDGGFPVGTVVAKLLFTTAPVSQGPWVTTPKCNGSALSTPIEWQAYVKLKFNAPGPTGLPIQPRTLTKVRLIQVDMMVRDERAKASGGWVFGTWVYNGCQGKYGNPWNNLQPVGLMWGDDPTVTSHPEGNPGPVKTITNPDLKETVINDDPSLPPMHLGFGLRLSGPVDNTQSSCKSCHSAAQYPAISPILPFLAQKDGRPLTCSDPEWRLWFRNLGPTDPFDKGAHALDNSLQLTGSIQNFLTARDMREGGYYAVQYWNGRPLLSIYGERGAEPADNAHCKS